MRDLKTALEAGFDFTECMREQETLASNVFRCSENNNLLLLVISNVSVYYMMQRNYVLVLYPNFIYGVSPIMSHITAHCPQTIIGVGR